MKVCEITVFLIKNVIVLFISDLNSVKYASLFLRARMGGVEKLGVK